MPGALGSLGNPSKILKILDFSSKILPESWKFSEFLPGSRESAPRARWPAQTLTDCPIPAKPTASSAPRKFGFRKIKKSEKVFCVGWMISESLILKVLKFPSDFNFPQPNAFFDSLAPPPGPMVIDWEYTRLLPQGLTSRLCLRNQ